MVNSRICAIVLIAFASSAGQMAWAQTPPLNAKLEAARIVVAAGKEVRSAADQAEPGDVVEYRATYANSGVVSVANVLATVPVPPGTTFIVGSAAPGNAQASTDGKIFAPMPLKRSVKLADGTLREELVPGSEYRAVRWEIQSLQAQKNAVVHLRVFINPPVSASVTSASALAAIATK